MDGHCWSLLTASKGNLSSSLLSLLFSPVSSPLAVLMNRVKKEDKLRTKAANIFDLVNFSKVNHNFHKYIDHKRGLNIAYLN